MSCQSDCSCQWQQRLFRLTLGTLGVFAGYGITKSALWPKVSLKNKLKDKVKEPDPLYGPENNPEKRWALFDIDGIISALPLGSVPAIAWAYSSPVVIGGVTYYIAIPLYNRLLAAGVTVNALIQYLGDRIHAFNAGIFVGAVDPAQPLGAVAPDVPPPFDGPGGGQQFRGPPTFVPTDAPPTAVPSNAPTLAPSNAPGGLGGTDFDAPSFLSVGGAIGTLALIGGTKTSEAIKSEQIAAALALAAASGYRFLNPLERAVTEGERMRLAQLEREKEERLQRNREAQARYRQRKAQEQLDEFIRIRDEQLELEQTREQAIAEKADEGDEPEEPLPSIPTEPLNIPQVDARGYPSLIGPEIREFRDRLTSFVSQEILDAVEEQPMSEFLERMGNDARTGLPLRNRDREDLQSMNAYSQYMLERYIDGAAAVSTNTRTLQATLTLLQEFVRIRRAMLIMNDDLLRATGYEFRDFTIDEPAWNENERMIIQLIYISITTAKSRSQPVPVMVLRLAMKNLFTEVIPKFTGPPDNFMYVWTHFTANAGSIKEIGL